MSDKISDPQDEEEMEFFTQQLLLLQEKAMLQKSVREEKKLLVENAKLKKDISDLKNNLQETQKRKAVKLHQERVLTASIASKSALLGEPAPSPRLTGARSDPSSSRPEGRRRRERRGVDAALLKTSESGLMREQKPDVSRLDLRVARILDVRKHPDSASLYVQEVELGEPAPRTVVSGLANHVPPEQLVGCLVVLLCNVRPVKVRGVQSQARLLCAVNQESMEPLTPPTSAQPGDRITFQNYPGEPEKELNPKQRIWERLLPDLCTDAKGVASYRGGAFEVRGKGLCRAPNISNGGIK
ncbi:aminoacyl tRNA synthase complex-interacting multifunctional protein 1 [Rhinichthys klamathensis goyatoka]|uniref:aminoacyl tRNA synthase complex-interacting multifunctional protein 1 n=1 Tax=Rhinichthys klamathensis goyatoka TaxID=3034132 RepID=UPI0024B62DAA|nr:aminoacyl tRNA synthase complex-interacting multifunctional protein 1 [Rhinichthys klamathensis goyatoka]XP_056092567.1 aminoacyl tRNA synthase complex-interacting multifunctional protein 1 [Rhinichthys klamathensis goyatoka]